MHNPIFGSLLQELHVAKKNIANNLIKKTPTPAIDLSIQEKIKAMRNSNSGFNRNNNNGGLTTPSPSLGILNNFTPPPAPSSGPLAFNLLQQPHYFQPPPPPSPLPSLLLSPLLLLRPKCRSPENQNQPSTHFREMTMIKTKITSEK